MSESSDRPLVTFALFAYNQERFIREAVAGALAQDYSPLEIILSDDCSEDRTYEIMCEMAEGYTGPHSLVLNRNCANLGGHGIGQHVNVVLQMSRGELIIFAAGDDISLPQRTSTLIGAWIRASKPDGLLHSAIQLLSINGTPGAIVHGNARFGDLSLRECARIEAAGVLGAANAITRSVFGYFDKLADGTFFEDRTLAFRSLMIGKVIYIESHLVQYRQHRNNISGRQMYKDEARWAKWNEGLCVLHRSFLYDYLNYCKLNKQSTDSEVIYEISKAMRRAERTRFLVSGTQFKRMLAMVVLLSNMPFPSRISFILHRAGLENTYLYQFLVRVLHFFRHSMVIIKKALGVLHG